MKSTENDIVYDTEGAARYLGLSPATLATKRCRGGGPTYVKYDEGAVRYLKSDLDAYRRACRVTNTGGGTPDE